MVSRPGCPTTRTSTASAAPSSPPTATPQSAPQASPAQAAPPVQAARRASPVRPPPQVQPAPCRAPEDDAAPIYASDNGWDLVGALHSKTWSDFRTYFSCQLSPAGKIAR